MALKIQVHENRLDLMGWTQYGDKKYAHPVRLVKD